MISTVNLRKLMTVSLPAMVICFAISIRVFSQDEPRRIDPVEAQLVSRAVSGDQEQRLDAIVKLGSLFTQRTRRPDDSTISALVNILQRDNDSLLRSVSARALELSGDARIAAPATEALKREKNAPVRKAIIYALARYPSSQISQTLISLLNDKNHEVRSAAAYALAEQADPSSESALIELLKKRRKDDDAFARREAARGLGRIGTRAGIEELLRALTRDNSADVRREAARSLGLIAQKQDSEVLAALRQAALSEDPYLTVIADHAVSLINSRSQ